METFRISYLKHKFFETFKNLQTNKYKSQIGNIFLYHVKNEDYNIFQLSTLNIFHISLNIYIASQNEHNSMLVYMFSG